MNSPTSKTLKTPLGKGIQSLLGDSSSLISDVQLDTTPDRVLEVDINLIDPNPEQPRREFKNEELKGLMESIKSNGVIQPLVVTESSLKGRFTLIAGERRLRASRMAGKQKVPILIKGISRNDWLKVALVENIQRADLNCIEEAMAYEALIKDYGLTQDQCAQQVGKERSTITNYLRILKLPKLVQDDLIHDRLTMGHARALLSLKSEKDVLEARAMITSKDLSVRATEKLCKSMAENQINDEEKKLDTDLEYIADQLRAHLKTKVRLHGSPMRGKIEVSYFSASELERIISLFQTT